MGILEIVLIGIGLSMDAAAVSMTDGMCYKQIKTKQVFLIAAFFGVFQGAMPLIGYYAGSVFSNQISVYDHWVALLLLGFIGGKMIYEAIAHKDEDCCKTFSIKMLLLQAIATSIDALAVGVSFAAIKVNVYEAVLIIAAITFALSFIAVYLGKRFGTLLNKKAELLGGIILVGIGLKIFIESMWG